MIRINPQTFVANWSEITRWDPVSFHDMVWHWPAEVLRPIGSVLKARKEKVDRTKHDFANLTPITIHFGGTISKRNVTGKNYSMELFFARPGDVVLSKIDLKNGAVTLVPEDWEDVVITGHFATYEPDLTQLLPAYFTRIIQAKPFKELLWRNKTGGEGRKEVKLDFFLSTPVPLPPLPVQAAIVAAYETGVAEAARLRQEAAGLEGETEKYFLTALGIENTYRPKRAKVQVLEWSRLARWSVEAAYEAIHGNGQPTSTLFPMVTLDEVSAVSYGIQKSPSNRPGMHPRPYLRVANVKSGYLDLNEIKYINVPDAQFPLFEVLPGDLLFVEGNGSRTELGRAALWNGEIDGCVHQNHLLKVRFDQKKVVPAFASRWFNTETGRGHFFRSAKTSSGLGTINSKEMRLAPIPLPPIEIQLSILEQDSLLRTQAAALRLAAAETEAATVARVEGMILGVN
ncbi:restriction endonuclease subunit S [Hymenobacter psychrophilus]|uniref:Type I restriction enzyme, S subunit n=1 Tax=Hymenobacter psychrophilus TaxID=651662 RepID=A0A1H3I6N7_9BACT|nr:hypothetical protein [Hymenobacter psychrophilus]SDY22859.1 type I restriction enzyme, S subunit [Hymenobacter psychrophilus]